MGNWNSKKVYYKQGRVFWRHDSCDKIYHVEYSGIGKYFNWHIYNEFHDIYYDPENEIITNKLTLYVVPMSENKESYKSLLKFASTWNIDRIHIRFRDISTTRNFIRDFSFTRIGTLVIFIVVDKHVNINNYREEYEEIEHALIKHMKSSQLGFVVVQIDNQKNTLQICNLSKNSTNLMKFN